MFYFTQINSLHFHCLKLSILSDFEISVFNTRIDWNATHKSRRDGNRGIATMQTRSFSVVGPKTRNGLPVDLSNLPNVACYQFHHLPKTVVFRLTWIGSAFDRWLYLEGALYTF